MFLSVLYVSVMIIFDTWGNPYRKAIDGETFKSQTRSPQTTAPPQDMHSGQDRLVRTQKNAFSQVVLNIFSTLWDKWIYRSTTFWGSLSRGVQRYGQANYSFPCFHYITSIGLPYIRLAYYRLITCQVKTVISHFIMRGKYSICAKGSQTSRSPEHLLEYVVIAGSQLHASMNNYRTG